MSSALLQILQRSMAKTPAGAILVLAYLGFRDAANLAADKELNP